VLASAQDRHLTIRLDTATRLAALYGEAATAILDEARSDQAATIPNAPTLLRAEVRYAVHAEHAQRLADVVLRRTEVGNFARPDDLILQTTAEEMARALTWSPERQAQELAAVRAVYPDLISPA
jgi:glycerol-3-phosphate dehydrogenase